MSAGPIQSERDAWAPLKVSTPDSRRVCFQKSVKAQRGYCGRTSAKARATNWVEVVCWDCVAAAIADGVRLPKGITG